ncbi:protein kinase [Myxacorys almedinensis A]|uniref:non-specific serine/threonine protein kinase n=2 Tax=Myxacorys TaxID=2056239 RepID=A0A8J7Z5W1_9CYAN|nr:protein kinase [Myxacorys almedinensis A]
MLGNRYLVQRILGQGGFGRTYLAADQYRFDELCVLKEFLPHKIGDYETQKSRDLFEQEAKILHQLEHAQIPKFLAYFEEDERLFLVQEFVKGRTYSSLLRERQQRGEAFSELEIVEWLQQLLPVLTYIHDRGIIHRDISPDNIMLHQDHNVPMLIDFGVGKWTINMPYNGDETKPEPETKPIYSRKHSVVGKIGYAPHEQLWMGQCFPNSDLYSLAVTAVVLLTGKAPQALIDPRSLEWQWRNFATVSDRFADMLNTMLENKPSERYSSAQDILAVLEERSLRDLTDGSQSADPVTVVSRPALPINQANTNQANTNRANTKQTNIEQTAPPLRVSPPAALSLNPIFINRCEQELMNYIGPIAAFLVNQVIREWRDRNGNPEQMSLTSEALVTALAEKIPNQHQAIEFQRQLLRL